MHAKQISPHLPVMLQNVKQLLNLQNSEKFLDMTFGAGGHSREILHATSSLHYYALDRDNTTEIYMRALEEQFKAHYLSSKFMIGKFSDLPRLLPFEQLASSFDAILMDIGVSSMQIDAAVRGFAYKSESCLDMRMSPNDSHSALTARDVVNNLSASELSKVFKVYGEEKNARRIANAIHEYRVTIGPIRTTGQLRDIVQSVAPRTDLDTVARIFQSLRIFVNDELNELCTGLYHSYRLLKPETGRLCVLSFHSLEDRIVKRCFNLHSTENMLKKLSTPNENLELKTFDSHEISQPRVWKRVTGPLTADKDELDANPRSSSAKLRFGVKN